MSKTSTPDQTANNTILLTPGELANRWKWHPESCRRWARERKIETIRIGRRILFPLAAIEALERDGFTSAGTGITRGDR